MKNKALAGIETAGPAENESCPPEEGMCGSVGSVGLVGVILGPSQAHLHLPHSPISSTGDFLSE